MKRVVAVLEKNAHEILKIELTEFGGHDLLGVRVWTRTTDRPTQKGVTLAVAMLPGLVEALTRAEAEAEARAAGLL